MINEVVFGSFSSESRTVCDWASSTVTVIGRLCNMPLIMMMDGSTRSLFLDRLQHLGRYITWSPSTLLGFYVTKYWPNFWIFCWNGDIQPPKDSLRRNGPKITFSRVIIVWVVSDTKWSSSSPCFERWSMYNQQKSFFFFASQSRGSELFGKIVKSSWSINITHSWAQSILHFLYL